MSGLLVQHPHSRSSQIAQATQAIASPPERWHLRVTGQVQGVGFRPFVHRVATRLHLAGTVANDGIGVDIHIQGSADRLAQFVSRLSEDLPSLAQIDTLDIITEPPLTGDAIFTIAPSASATLPTTAVTADAALCSDCLMELLDAYDRRHRYALINCTNCGPRYSIVRDVPYDRANTTMADFEMCDACATEYAAASDRRFHAQPTACPDCGPQLRLLDGDGDVLPGDAIVVAVQLLLAGQILAIKGIGGYHLVVRATDDAAVRRLRRHKHRDAKPLALLVRDLEAARALVELNPADASLMQSAACPIVIAPRQVSADLSPAIAAGTHRLGVMLPYTPIQHLLLQEGGDALGPLVCTSANRSDEPLAIANDEVARRLSDVYDAVLEHNRPIERCVDDSVFISMGDAAPLPIRRARGYVPRELPMPVASPDGLAVGGELKNTVTAVRDGRAIVGQHIGDLKHPLTYQHFDRAIDDMVRLFHVRPQWIACDLHPQYMSRSYTDRLSMRWHALVVEVQHHHAHAASLLVEHRRTDPILAVVCDGVGYGSDGTAWGGELLLADLLTFVRLTHLRPIRLAGGDAAAKDTRRCALGLLHQAYGEGFADLPITQRLIPNDAERRMLCSMIQRNVNCVASSAAGRVFDGVAALLGVCKTNRFGHRPLTADSTPC